MISQTFLSLFVFFSLGTFGFCLSIYNKVLVRIMSQLILAFSVSRRCPTRMQWSDETVYQQTTYLSTSESLDAWRKRLVTFLWRRRNKFPSVTSHPRNTAHHSLVRDVRCRTEISFGTLCDAMLGDVLLSRRKTIEIEFQQQQQQLCGPEFDDLDAWMLSATIVRRKWWDSPECQWREQHGDGVGQLERPT